MMPNAMDPDALVDAGAYLYAAKRYQKAASRLLDSIRREPDDETAGFTSLSNPIYSDPLYYLCAHTMELAFKAFMRFHGKKVPRDRKDGHALVGLHEACVRLGLQVGGDPRDLPNVVKLLAFEHDVQGFRYHHDDTKVVPDPSWACAVAKTLVQAVGERIGDDHGFPSPKRFKMRFVMPRHIYINEP